MVKEVDEVAVAQKAMDDLVAERREKRRTSTPDEWRKYNEKTADQQIATQKAVNDAIRLRGRDAAFAAVGTINEKDES